jgi:hypothetical protein
MIAPSRGIADHPMFPESIGRATDHFTVRENVFG